MRLALIVVALLAGCARAQQQAERVERDVIVSAPVQLATPLGPIEVGPVRVERVSAAKERTESEVSIPLAAAGSAALPAAAPSFGWAGWAAGISGIIAAIAAFLRKRSVEQSLRQVVSGVEAAKLRLPEDGLRALLDELDARCSSDTKRRVRDARARSAS
ncbi:MAG: hypothetical protein N2690_05120 [Rhodocyclaceae bacterium]|nr:hypothetical protein [Rhodocyclaceae bacterium]